MLNLLKLTDHFYMAKIFWKKISCPSNVSPNHVLEIKNIEVLNNTGRMGNAIFLLFKTYYVFPQTILVPKQLPKTRQP